MRPSQVHPRARRRTENPSKVRNGAGHKLPWLGAGAITASSIAAGLGVAQAPAAFADAASYPGSTLSLYTSASSYDAATFRSRGCSVAQASGSSHALIILDFGGQEFRSGTWGAREALSATWHSDNDIYVAAKNFAKGYYQCAPVGWTAMLGIGTNNSLDGINAAGGAAWGGLATNARNWVNQQGFGDVTVQAANDIEPGFGNNFAGVQDWANNLGAGTNYYDYGSADGCPASGGDMNTLCSPGWTVGNVFTVAWKNTNARAVPEIYGTDGHQAHVWKNISNIGSRDFNHSRIYFSGTLTQYKSCLQTQSGCVAGSQHFDNPPADGWQQLENLVGQSTLAASDIGHW